MDAPSARTEHVAVWTGDRMVVWGGRVGAAAADVTDTGGVYDPATWTWTVTSPVGAPAARRRPTVVWTGDRMLVWGGVAGSTPLGTGAAYDSQSNTWTPIAMANAPAARYDHTAVWAESLGWMIVFGGHDGVNQLGSAAAYDPVADTWTTLPAATVGRQGHTAVWDDAGGRMLIYGGIGDDGVQMNVPLPSGSVSGGMSLDPVLAAWSGLTQSGQPAARYAHAAALVNGLMVIWGGSNGATPLGTGARYDPMTLGWMMTNSPEPESRSQVTAVSLGTPAQVCIWGGLGVGGALGSGALYDPSTNAWSALPTALSARNGHTAVSTGSSMIVWGGQNGSVLLGDGGVYTP